MDKKLLTGIAIGGVGALLVFLSLRKNKNPVSTFNHTVAVDFDGVIADYHGWAGAFQFGNILPGAKEALQELKDMGYAIVVFTTRGDTPAIREYLTKNQIPYDSVTDKKIKAEVYIDDRAMRFDGTWDGIPNRVHAFKPWHKKVGLNKQHVMTMEDGTELYRINGTYMRDPKGLDFIKFIDGGHYLVYPERIPPPEMWVEDDLNEEDFQATTVHEYVEMKKMRDKGWSYDRAHEYANSVETVFRKMWHEKTGPTLNFFDFLSSNVQIEEEACRGI